MQYLFSPAMQALLNSGALQQVFSTTGQVLPLLRDPQTGRFVAMAVGAATNGTPIAPLLISVQAVAGVANMIQTQAGLGAIAGQLSTIQTTLGVLQATTAFIGLGTVAVAALSAVNLHQTLKLRQDVKKLHHDMKDGFLNLEQALNVQGAEIIQRLEEIPNEVEFRAHRQALTMAYGRFLEASSRIETAMLIEDGGTRNMVLANIQQTLGEAVADYRNPHLLSELGAAGQLRRYECAWAIEHAIAITYQLQDAPAALSKHLSELQNKIRRDVLAVVDSCEYEEEIDFIFPEIARIQNHDLALLSAWQEQIDWARSLPPSELELLRSADFDQSLDDAESAVPASEMPGEQVFYKTLKQKSHLSALCDHLRFTMKPELRKNHEAYVSTQAAQSGQRTLTSSNLRQMSDLAVANLYWYFKVREVPEMEETVLA